MRRTARPLTPADLATIRAFGESLRASFRAGVEAVAGLNEATEQVRDSARYGAAAAAMVRTFDAAPRHRHLPTRATVIDWLDRHAPPVQLVDDPWREYRFDQPVEVQPGVEYTVRYPTCSGGQAELMFVEPDPFDLPSPAERVLGAEYVARYRADPEAFEREFRRERVNWLPYDGPPADVERDDQTGYRSMWPGGIGG